GGGGGPPLPARGGPEHSPAVEDARDDLAGAALPLRAARRDQAGGCDEAHRGGALSGIVILGAGPTGLGAGYRLRERGESGFEILEPAGAVAARSGHSSLRAPASSAVSRRPSSPTRAIPGTSPRKSSPPAIPISINSSTSSSARKAFAASTGRAESSSSTVTSATRSR